MKRIFIVVVLVGIAGVAGLVRMQSRSSGAQQQSASATASESANQAAESREEIRKSYRLAPDAQVTIAGINGRVVVKTSETDTAEVYVVRTATSHDSLMRRRVVIEETSSSLVIRAEDTGTWWSRLFGGRTPNEEVTISAPRRIALRLKGINGRVTGGDVEGALEVSGVNGRVELSQLKGSAKVSGINGSVSLGLRELNERGVEASGVNGNIELRVPVGLNADLVAKGMNGKVRSEIPEVSLDHGEYGSSYSAHLGNGGAPIKVSGINGNVVLTRLAAAEVGSDKPTLEKKSAANAKPAL